MDEDLARFHDGLLGTAGLTWSAGDGLEELGPPPEFVDRALALVSGQAGRPGARAWRDPRATLFLPVWDRALPQARWILAVRDPADLVWSLLRRNVFDEILKTPVARAVRGARLWTLYHRRILDFPNSASSWPCRAT